MRVKTIGFCMFGCWLAMSGFGSSQTHVWKFANTNYPIGLVGVSHGGGEYGTFVFYGAGALDYFYLKIHLYLFLFLCLCTFLFCAYGVRVLYRKNRARTVRN